MVFTGEPNKAKLVLVTESQLARKEIPLERQVSGLPLLVNTQRQFSIAQSAEYPPYPDMLAQGDKLDMLS